MWHLHFLWLSSAHHHCWHDIGLVTIINHIVDRLDEEFMLGSVSVLLGSVSLFIVLGVVHATTDVFAVYSNSHTPLSKVIVMLLLIKIPCDIHHTVTVFSIYNR